MAPYIYEAGTKQLATPTSYLDQTTTVTFGIPRVN